MTESEIKAYIASEVAAQLQAITSKDIASESDVPTLSDAEWDTNNSITSLPVVYNGSAWRKIGAGFLRTLRNAAAVVSTAWNSLTNNGTDVSWIPTVNAAGNAGKTSPADLAAVLGACSNNPSYTFGVYSWWTDGGYIRIASTRKSYPRGCLFLSGYWGIAFIIIGGLVDSFSIEGSKLLYSPNMSQLDLWYAEEEGYWNIYTNVTGDIYKLEIYNIDIDKSRAEIIHTESLPSGAVHATIA